MAEIHVQAKKPTTTLWPWILLALIIIGVVVYMLTRNNNRNREVDINTPGTTTKAGLKAPQYNAVMYQQGLASLAG
jgi:hypothetical protein